MSDRKNINKHRKLECQYDKHLSLKKKKILSIRFMIPFDVVCSLCRRIIKEGKKINALKEKVINETYLRLDIFRFYFKCPSCTKGLSIKSDLQTASYYPEINCKKLATISHNEDLNFNLR